MQNENYQTWKVVQHDRGFSVIDQQGDTVATSTEVQESIRIASDVAKFRKLDGVIFAVGVKIASAPMRLMPPPLDRCPVCATQHGSNAAHNQMSLYYQYRFYGTHGRWPTWADAIAHLPQKIQDRWRECLMRTNMWSEPADGIAIADPPSESIHQTIEIPARSEVIETCSMSTESQPE